MKPIALILCAVVLIGAGGGGPPSQLSCSPRHAEGGQHISVEWLQPAGVDHYRLRRSDWLGAEQWGPWYSITPDGWPAPAGTYAHFDDRAIVIGQTYRYRVRAIHPGGRVAVSTEFCGATRF